MKILTEKEAAETVRYFEEAAHVAQDALCLRAKCGSVIVKNEKIVGRGFNAPPQNDLTFRRCLDEYEIPAGFRHDRTCCIHAEQRAILDAIRAGEDLTGATIYFTSLHEDGKRKLCHRLCCTICSRAVLDAGISQFVLEWEDGSVRSWSASEFDQLSFECEPPTTSRSGYPLIQTASLFAPRPRILGFQYTSV